MFYQQAKEILDGLSSKIDSTEEYSLLSGGELCPVCACPAFNLTVRLQLCNHLYCCDCLLTLVEQAKFPIQCCAEVSTLITIDNFNFDFVVFQVLCYISNRNSLFFWF